MSQACLCWTFYCYKIGNEWKRNSLNRRRKSGDILRYTFRIAVRYKFLLYCDISIYQYIVTPLLSSLGGIFFQEHSMIIFTYQCHTYDCFARGKQHKRGNITPQHYQHMDLYRHLKHVVLVQCFVKRLSHYTYHKLLLYLALNSIPLFKCIVERNEQMWCWDR